MVGVTFLELSIWSTRRISFAGGQTSVFDPWPLCLNPYPAARAAVVPLRGWWPPLVGAALQCSKHNAAGAASPSRSLCAPHEFITHHGPLYISYFTQAHLFKLIASSFYFIQFQSCDNLICWRSWETPSRRNIKTRKHILCTFTNWSSKFLEENRCWHSFKQCSFEWKHLTSRHQVQI